MTDPPPPSPVADAILARGAVLAGLCRLVPVPFLDDYLLKRANRHVVGSLLKLRGRAESVEHVRPIYDDGKGCLAGVVWFLLTLPFKIVLKIVAKLLKTIFFVLAIRDAALQVGSTLLLGRAVDRCLLDGRLPPETAAAGPGTPAWLAAEGFQTAFAVAFKGSDLRLLGQLFSGVLRGAKGVLSLAADAPRRLLGRKAAENATLPADEQAQVDGLVAKLTGLLHQPEVEAYFAAFDQRFDEAWGASPAARPSGPGGARPS